jgi:hypothetical protein
MFVRMVHWTSTMAMLVAVALAQGCSKEVLKETPTATKPVTTPAASLIPASLLLTAAPKDPQDVGALKATAKEGDRVVLRGKVGGKRKPFVEGRAAMLVADVNNIRSCEKMPDDACKSPWDYCCEDPVAITANTATLQVNDATGNPLRTTLEGFGGIAPLKVVVVEGVVAPRPGPAVLVVVVTGVFVEP